MDRRAAANTGAGIRFADLVSSVVQIKKQEKSILKTGGSSGLELCRLLRFLLVGFKCSIAYNCFEIQEQMIITRRDLDLQAIPIQPDFVPSLPKTSTWSQCTNVMAKKRSREARCRRRAKQWFVAI